MDRDAVGEERAASDYLRWLSPRLKENDRLKGERDWIQSEHERLTSRFAAREQEVQAVQERLNEEIAQSEQKAIEFGHRARAAEQKADALAKELADKEAQLASMTNTLGWRLLSHFGPIKYNFVLPAYRRLQKLLSSGER
jgi:septal ring factor EnvC (AmiA/AmiB activator)